MSPQSDFSVIFFHAEIYDSVLLIKVPWIEYLKRKYGTKRDVPLSGPWGARDQGTTAVVLDEADFLVHT